MISERAKRIKPSATLEIVTKAEKMIAEGIDVIRFDAGDPDFSVPEHIKVRNVDLAKELEILSYFLSHKS